MNGGVSEFATFSAAAKANSFGLPTTKVSKVKRGSSRALSSSLGPEFAASAAAGSAAAAGWGGRTRSVIERTEGLSRVQSTRMRSA